MLTVFCNVRLENKSASSTVCCVPAATSVLVIFLQHGGHFGTRWLGKTAPDRNLTSAALSVNAIAAYFAGSGTIRTVSPSLPGSPGVPGAPSGPGAPAGPAGPGTGTGTGTAAGVAAGVSITVVAGGTTVVLSVFSQAVRPTTASSAASRVSFMVASLFKLFINVDAHAVSADNHSINTLPGAFCTGTHTAGPAYASLRKR